MIFDVPQEVQYIIDELEKKGFEAYITGEFVRDNIMGRKPYRCDICTSASPDEIAAVFSSNEIISLGLKQETVTISVDKKPFEIISYYSDVNNDSRPDNAVLNDITSYLKQRVFTVNAMAYNPKTGVFDPFGGIKAIEEKKIVCVGCAAEIFSEDAIETLHAVRLAAQLDFEIDCETEQAIHKFCGGLESVPAERIREEFKKIAVCGTFHTQLIKYTDVFEAFIPELRDMIGFDQKNPYHCCDAFEHTVHAVENAHTNDLTTRLAVFFHDFGKPHSYQDDKNGIRHFRHHGHVGADITDAIMTRLKFDNNMIDNVTELVYFHEAAGEASEKSVKRLLGNLGEEQYRRLLIVRRADIAAQNRQYYFERFKDIIEIEHIMEKILTEEPSIKLKDLAVDGNDVMEALRIGQGKEVGDWLNDMLQKVISGELENTMSCLMEYLHRGGKMSHPYRVDYPVMCVDRKRRKNGLIGFCHILTHRGYLTAELLKKHDCLAKNCPFLKKFEECSFWQERAAAEKKRIEAKNKKKERQIIEAKNIECENNALRLARELTKDIPDCKIINAVRLKDGVVKLTYTSKGVIDFSDIAERIRNELNCGVYVHKAKLSAKETNKLLGLRANGERINEYLENVYTFCSNNQPDIIIAETCGCFYCRQIFDSSEITEFVKGSVSDIFESGICPRCGKANVLPETDAYELTQELLDEMNTYYFGK